MRNAHFQHKTLWQGDRDTTLIGKQQAIQSPKPPASHSDAMVQVADEHSSSKQGTAMTDNVGWLLAPQFSCAKPTLQPAPKNCQASFLPLVVGQMLSRFQRASARMC